METYDYKELRAASKSVHSKVLDATKGLKGFDLIKIARRLTLPISGQTLLFHDETAQNAFFDFWYHEYRVEGRSLAESVDTAKAGLTELELKMLEAHRRSRTSLFQIEEAFPIEHQVRMRDLLEPEQPEIVLTDFGLSESLTPQVLKAALFFRLVTLGEVSMSSGVFFVFPKPFLPEVLRTYDQNRKFVPAADLPQKRFIFFFRRYHLTGVEQQYQDIL